jgi:hypothetical protein
MHTGDIVTVTVSTVSQGHLRTYHQIAGVLGQLVKTGDHVGTDSEFSPPYARYSVAKVPNTWILTAAVTSLSGLLFALGASLQHEP